MAKYNHMYDVAFSLENENEDGEATAVELIAALEKRVAALKALPPQEAREAFGYSDSYEVAN